MGEVYRARDTRLDRTVAIKVLPAHLSASAQARERFEREAKAISSLSHPHICPLYDVGHQDGTDFLVMEYLEGETLADRLKKGRLPLEQVLQYAIQIADALDAAHSHGVIHRDLKPGNIMLTKSGAKLLDFGLAKAHAAEAVAGMTAGTTQTTPLTGEGTILGTLQYMAPEQLEGAGVDARTDLFALGAVIYEMATGKKAFEGKGQASLIAAILERDPPPVSTIQSVCPPALDHVVQTCLAKAPDSRWRTAHDISIELKWIALGGSEAKALTGSARRMRMTERLAWVAGAILLALLAGWAVTRLDSPPQERAVQFELTVPGHPDAIVPIVSPDGEYMAIPAVFEGNKAAIFLRPLNSPSIKVLAGTEGSFTAFWSPDSKQLAFASESGLKRISIAGGSAQTICKLPPDGRGDWSRDGEILFRPGGNQPLYRVSAAGGEPRPATKLDVSRQEIYHGLPQFLPDGRHFLYWAGSKNPENNSTYLASLDSPVVKRILVGNEAAYYSPPGYLTFTVGSRLAAQSFDTQHATLVGEPITITNTFSNTGGVFSVSSNGVLAYHTEPPVGTRLTWLDRNGKHLGTLGDIQDYTNPAISPDQKKVAVGIRDAKTQTRDIWIMDIQRGTNFRLTFDPAEDFSPTWSPDGSKIAFSSDRKGKSNIYLRAADGGGADELLAESGEDKRIGDWSGDGQLLLYDIGPAEEFHEGLFSFRDRKLAPLKSDKFMEEQGRFCPNGGAKPRWFAYTSSETGGRQVYVQSVDGALAGRGARLQISNSGGMEPFWRGDGKELFYLNANKLMAVDVNGAGETFQAGVPKELFEAPFVTDLIKRNRYDVTRDGKRFLVITPADEKQEQKITVIVNWPALLKH
jgi:Tol biopolymer transport system component